MRRLHADAKSNVIFFAWEFLLCVFVYILKDLAEKDFHKFRSVKIISPLDNNFRQGSLEYKITELKPCYPDFQRLTIYQYV